MLRTLRTPADPASMHSHHVAGAERLTGVGALQPFGVVGPA